MPLYPTEKIIWDENIVPTEYYSGEGGYFHMSLPSNYHNIMSYTFALIQLEEEFNKKSMYLFLFKV